MTIEVIDRLSMEAAKYELRPNSKPQSTFLALPHEFFEAGYGGTAFTGKTFALVTLPLFKRVHEINGFYGKIWRRSFPQIQESLEPESNKWYPHFGYTYNSQDHVWTNKSTKSQIAFGFLDKDSDALKHDSAQYHYLGFEECTQFTKFMYTYLLHRCRSDISGWTAICRNAATPGDIGNTWYRKHFVEPAPNGYRTIEGVWRDIKTGAEKTVKRIFCRAFKEDNVDGLRNDPTYYDRLLNLPETLQKAKIYGDFWAFQGQVFEEFRTFHIEGEPENAVHVVEPQSVLGTRYINSISGFVPPDWWPKLIAIDWGYRHGNYITWCAVSPYGELIKYREHLRFGESIKHWGSEAKRASQFDGNIVRVVIDPMTRGHFGDEKSIKEQVEDATGWQIEYADNDRIGGKQLLHELFRWQPRPKRFDQKTGFDEEFAQKLLRMKGTELYQSYVNEFLADNTVEVLPKFKVFSHCTAFIDSIQACVYDEGEGRARHRAEDVKKQDGDDPYDAVRYVAKEYERFVKGVNSEWSKRCEINSALDEFRRTGDYATYDNRLSVLEKKEEGPIGHRNYIRPRKHSRLILH